MGADMSEPHKPATDPQVTFRQAIPTMLLVLGVIVAGALFKFYVLGHRPKTIGPDKFEYVPPQVYPTATQQHRSIPAAPGPRAATTG
jgi:hypothetical protein